MPNIQHIPCCEATLLGAPGSDKTAIDTVLSSKLAVVCLLVSRLTSLNAHDAFLPLEELHQHAEAALLAALCDMLQEHHLVGIR